MQNEDRDVSLWVVLGGILIFSLVLVVVGQTENPVWPLLLGGCFFILAYRLYGAPLSAQLRWIEEQKTRPTGPDDDVVSGTALVGFQFAALAGAGALVGPGLAVQYGLVPALFWILFGAVFGVAVHDLMVLTLARETGGRTWAEIIQAVLGPIAGLAGGVLGLLFLIVALANLGVQLSFIMNNEPRAVLALVWSVITGLIALLWGKVRSGKDGEAALIGALFLAAGVLVLAQQTPQPGAPTSLPDTGLLLVVIAIYTAIVAILPASLFSRPKGSAVGLWGLIVLAGGTLLVALAAPAIRLPDRLSLPVNPLPAGVTLPLPDSLFPGLLLALGGGLLGGWHTIVNSGPGGRWVGTNDRLPVSYGVALAEAGLALVALTLFASFFPSDFYVVTGTSTVNTVQQLTGQPVRELERWNQFAGESLLNRPSLPTALSASVGQAYTLLPAAQAQRAPQAYHLAWIVQAILLLAALEIGVRAGRMQIVGLATTALSWPPLTIWRERLNQLPWYGLSGLAAALLSLLWLALAQAGAGAYLLRLVMGLSPWLMAVALSLGMIQLWRRQIGSGRLWAIAPGVPLVVLVLAGLLTLGQGIPAALDDLDAQKAGRMAYQSLPTLVLQSRVVTVERARIIVQSWSAAEAGKVLADTGATGLATELKNRFGEPTPGESQKLADLIAQQAATITLWGWLRVIGLLLGAGLAIATWSGAVWWALRPAAAPTPPPSPPAPPQPPAPTEDWVI